MQTARAEHGVHTCASGTLVIFTRVEGLLRQRAGSLCEMPPDALAALAAARVPLVLVSESGTEDVQRLQRDLGLQQPFVCNGGATLHIPPGYFTDQVDGPDREWEIFSFTTAGPAAAVRLLSALFIARGHDKILTVGLGCDCSDATMLAAVDIPIIVRDQHRNQTALLQHLPGAYLTNASGATGWLEAVLGPQFSNA